MLSRLRKREREVPEVHDISSDEEEVLKGRSTRKKVQLIRIIMPAKLSADIPADIPAVTQEDIPADIPAVIQADIPAEIPANTTAEVQAEVPADIPAEIHADTPAEHPVEINSTPNPSSNSPEGMEVQTPNSKVPIPNSKVPIPNSKAPIPWSFLMQMGDGETDVEEDELLWDPARDGLGQEEEELLKDPELELCRSYISSLKSTIILMGGVVPPPPTGLRGQVGSPEMGLGSPISDRTLSPVQESSQGGPSRDESRGDREGEGRDERTLSRGEVQLVQERVIRSQVARVGGGATPARSFFNGDPAFWFQDSSTQEWERRGGEIYALELIREAFQLGVAFVHLPTLKPVRFKTYASIRKSLTGHVSQGTSLATMANRVAAAGDAVADMRSECRRMRERMIPAPRDRRSRRIEEISRELVEVPFRGPIQELDKLCNELDRRSGSYLSSDEAILLKRRIGGLVGDHLYPVSNLLKVWQNFMRR